MSTLSTKSRHALQQTAACSSRMLASRRIGMETEYATLIHDQLSHLNKPLPSAKSVYRSLIAAMRTDQPSAPGLYDNDQFFFTNGAAVTFESHPALQNEPGGLVEIATPEVNCPSDLLACQRGIDQMIERAASECRLPGERTPSLDVRVLKNSADGLGHVYGCQENYETDVADGAWLWVYRVCVLGVWCSQVLCSILAAPLMGLIIAATVIKAWRMGKAGNEEQDAGEVFAALPSWLTTPPMFLIQMTHLPIAWQVRFIGRHVAFRRQRQVLTAHLVSRIVLCGTGELDSKGRFFLSAKSMVTNRLADLGGFQGERPIFVYGHWFAQLCGKSAESWWRTRRLLGKRQRMQIGLSDSNMSEMAEFVKVGSVCLLLDMIEAGQADSLPRLKQPLAALYRIAGDWNLVRRVQTSAGKMTALELQTALYTAAESFVDQTSANVRGEAEVILQAWKTLLDSAVRFRRNADDYRPSLGRLDWLTKRWLIDRQGKGGTWAARKKIDLRYHELSENGYFRQLTEGRIEETLATVAVRKQRAVAPPSS